MRFTGETKAYRIGWREPLLTRRVKPWKQLHRPWQAEDGTQRFARRALTARAAERRVLRDATVEARTGRKSFTQARRSWWANMGEPPRWERNVQAAKEASRREGIR